MILIDDGRIALRATEVTDTDVITEVIVGGPVSNNKGINLPGVGVSVPAMSEKDTEDLRWAFATASTWWPCLLSAPPRTSSWSTRSWTRKVAGFR